MLEPLSVAIQASRRGKIIQGSSVIVFGAGTVGLLCAAMSKVAGATSVVIADIQPQKTGFALKHSFADHGIVVRAKRGHDIEEKLQIARETAVLARQTLGAAGVVDSDFDVVLECTGAEACTQAAIYVSSPFMPGPKICADSSCQATRPGGKFVIVGMGNPVQTLPISAAALREVYIVGTFRYANTYPEAIQLINSLPDLRKLCTHHYKGLENVGRAFEMAARTHDDNGNLVLKVIIKMGDDE